MQRIKRRIYTYDEVGIYHAHSVQCVDDKKDIKICHVNYDNINDALSFQSKQYIKCFKEFLDNGDIGYYAYLGGECVHRTWTKSNGVAAIHAFYTIPLHCLPIRFLYIGVKPQVVQEVMVYLPRYYTEFVMNIPVMRY